MIRKLTTAALVALAIVAPAAAHADPVEDQPGGVHVTRISSAPDGPRITVTLSNGRTDQLRPCRAEDGRRCYWDAATMGNGRGSSFVVTAGTVFQADLSAVVGAR